MVSIKSLLNELNKKLDGRGVLLTASELEDPYAHRIPTGSLGLDCVCGGGIPQTGITEYIGLEGSGKTMLALKTAAEAQKLFKDKARIAYVSVESPLDVGWAEKLGVRLDDSLIEVRAESGEDYLNTIKELINSLDFQLIVIDSIPALTSLAELEGLIGDSHVADRARLIAAFIRHCVWGAKKPSDNKVNTTAIVAINQYQAKVGGFSPLGAPKESKGGYALRYAKLIGIELASGQLLSESENKEDKLIYGKQIKYRIIKGKAGCAEGGQGSFDFIFKDYGKLKAGEIDLKKELRICGIKYGVIVRSGRYFKYGGKNYEKAELEELIEDPKIYNNLRQEILKKAIGELRCG